MVAASACASSDSGRSRHLRDGRLARAALVALDEVTGEVVRSQDVVAVGRYRATLTLDEKDRSLLLAWSNRDVEA